MQTNQHTFCRACLDFVRPEATAALGLSHLVPHLALQSALASGNDTVNPCMLRSKDSRDDTAYHLQMLATSAWLDERHACFRWHKAVQVMAYTCDSLSAGGNLTSLHSSKLLLKPEQGPFSICIGKCGVCAWHGLRRHANSSSRLWLCRAAVTHHRVILLSLLSAQRRHCPLVQRIMDEHLLPPFASPFAWSIRQHKRVCNNRYPVTSVLAVKGQQTTAGSFRATRLHADDGIIVNTGARKPCIRPAVGLLPQ